MHYKKTIPSGISFKYSLVEMMDFINQLGA